LTLGLTACADVKETNTGLMGDPLPAEASPAAQIKHDPACLTAYIGCMHASGAK